MPIVGFEVYPTDPLTWVNIDDKEFVKEDEVILRLPDEVEEACYVRKILEPEQFQEMIKSDDRMAITDNVTYLRHASENDKQKLHANLKRIPEALIACRKIVETHHLNMQLVTAHFSFSGNQLMFIFTAEGRVDFRDLVKDLVRSFKKQIRLKQIGPRDRSKFIGGFGKCGRSLCCATHLDKLDSVTMDMARVQNLHSKGASKISGICGKLLCCLAYEMKVYQDLRKNMPDTGTRVRIGKDEGVVIGQDVLNQTLKIKFSTDYVDHVPLEKAKIVKVSKESK